MGALCIIIFAKFAFEQNQVAVPNFCDALTRITKVRALGFAIIKEKQKKRKTKWAFRTF